MGFVDDVQSWLRPLGSPSVPLDALPSQLDLAERRAVLWDAIDELPPMAQEAAHKRWTRPGYLEAFVAHVAAGLQRGFARQELLAEGIDAAIVARVSFTPVDRSTRGASFALEVEHLSREAASVADSVVFASDEALWAWARGTHVVDPAGRPTEIGRALAALTGREAQHFVLELEIALSTGTADTLRVARRTLERLFREGSISYAWAVDASPGCSTEVQEHLVALGVATKHAEEDAFIELYALDEDARELVRGVIDGGPNPYRTLVSALLDARRGRVAAEIAGQPVAAAPDFAYVQMIVHEMRNTLLPLQNAISRLWPELERAERPDPARVSELRERIDRSLTRLADFTRDSARLASAVAPEPFSSARSWRRPSPRRRPTGTAAFASTSAGSRTPRSRGHAAAGTSSS